MQWAQCEKIGYDQTRGIHRPLSSRRITSKHIMSLKHAAKANQGGHEKDTMGHNSDRRIIISVKSVDSYLSGK